MKQAKASERDINDLINLFQIIDHYRQHGTIMLEGDEELEVDESRFLSVLWAAWDGRADISWARVIANCELLIANCCDPDSRTLEWKPKLAKLIAAAEDYNEE